MVILRSATTVAEARWLEANGGSPGAGLVGTMALVPQIVDAMRVPVVAAGGIADGRGVAAAFALGVGVSRWVRLFGLSEATVSPLYRAQLRAATDEISELKRGRRDCGLPGLVAA
jgi:nitronate monooxygenase